MMFHNQNHQSKNADLAELERKLMNIQRSTRTTLPLFSRAHDWLRMKSRWYYSWHTKPNRSKLHGWIAAAYAIGAVFTFINFSLYYGVNSAAAASYTWDGGGATNNWSDCDNWSSNICPTSADIAVFNSTSTKDSVVDASFGGVIGQIGMNPGYTGTLSLARSLQNAGTFAIADGTFTAGSHMLDQDGTLTLTGGTFNAPSTTMTLAGGLTVNGGTFNNNNGTVTIDGAGTGGVTCTTSITFNHFIFAHTAGTKTINSGCTLPLGNDPTIGSTTAPIVTLAGGTLTGTGTATFSGALSLSSGSTPLSGFTGLVVGNTFTVNGATVNLGSYTTATFNGSFAISSGTFTAPSGIMTLASTFTSIGGTFNANGGTVTFAGTGTITCGSVTFSLTTFNNTTGTRTVSSSCNLPLGNNPTLSGTQAVTVNGTLSGTGTLTKTSNALTLNTGSSISGFSGIAAAAFTVAGATADLGSYSSFSTTGVVTVSSGSLTLPNHADLNSGLTISGGTFTAPSSNMTVAGSLTISGTPTFNANSGTITFDEGASSVTLSCNNVTFNLVAFNNTATKNISSNCSLPLGDNPTLNGAGTVSLTGTLSGTGTLTKASGTLTLNAGAALSGISALDLTTFTISGATADLSSYTSFTTASSVTINSGSLSLPNGADLNSTFSLIGGTFNAPSGNMTVASTFSVTGGTFNHNNGTITFDGSTSNSIACGSAVLNLAVINSVGTKTISSGCTVPLGNNPTVTGVTVDGTLSGTGTLTGGTMTLRTGTPLLGFTGLNAGALIVSGATVDLSSYSSFATSATSTLSSGSLSVPNNADFNSGLTISGGTFNAPSGNMTLAGALTISGSPTFNHNNGTVTIDGGLAVSLSCNNVTFNLVAFNNTASKTVNSDCILPLGNNPTLGGTSGVTVNGTLSGSGTLQKNGTGTITLNAGASLSGFTGFVTGPEISGLTISGATVDFGNYNPVVINGGVTINSGSLKAPSAGMTIRNNFINNTASGAAFNANGGTVTFGNNGLGGGTITCNGVTFHRVVLAIGMTIASDCTIPLGHDPVTANSTTLNGTLTGSGTLTATTGTFTFNSTTARITGFSALTFGSDSTAANLTVTNGATADLSSYSSVVVRGNVTMTSGTLTAPSGIFQIGGNFTNTDGTFNHNNGTVEFISRTANATNLINAGNVTFANLSATASSTNNSIIFQSGTTVTILKDLTIQGVDSSKKITIRTSTTGQTATIDPQGNRTIRHASVLDMINSNATPIAAGNGTVTNSGNNTGWNFFTPTVTSLGPTSATNGSKLTTNLPAFTFTLADSDTNDNVTYQIQVDNNSSFASPEIDATSASMKPAATTYTTTKALADGSYYWRVRAIDTAQQTSEWATANAGKIAFTIGTSITETPTESSGVTSAIAENSDIDNPTQRFTVVIRLLDANKQPIVGAKVTLRSEPKETISDSEGYARFEDVELGEHTLTVEHNGQIGEQKIAITKDTVANLDPDKEGTISITVELKNVEAAPAQSRMIYALYGVTGALALIFIAMLIMLRRRTQSIVPKY